MELILQGDLPHQIQPVEAIAEVFKDVSFEPGDLYSNPVFDVNSLALSANLKAIKSDEKNNLPSAQLTNIQIETPFGIDVRMETGTGKTYVYTRTIFELHKRYGISKFILIVPTVPIKAGAQDFLSDYYVGKHFADTLGYDTKIELYVATPMKSKKGKRFFPSEVRSFVGSKSPDKIQVFLVNQALLSGSAKVLSRNDYDTGVFDFFRPFDALRATRPFVIIDEPHKFDKTNATYKVITEELAPQCIIRFGATFPVKSQGKGKNRIQVDDFANLVYDLRAKDAFEQNLIKGVIKEHLEIPNVSDEKVKIMSVEKGRSAVLRHTKAQTSINYEFAIGEPLSRISPEFGDITITDVGKDFIVFSNSQEKKKDEEFAVDTYSVSYQEEMLRLALKRHFETERENFERPIRIKTLALFFIDSISSYRGDNGENAWLQDMFDRLLKERIDYELSQPCSDEYRAYLENSKSDIEATKAAYFAQDNATSDEDIEREVDAILHKKKELLSFNGELGTCRFLFSKWTLREGWDNPNVFTIAKLRSSGSEISKLQEVGRGLRLPVDELGNRISNEIFMLNYIIDFTEKDFANKLVEEINEQRNEALTVIPHSLMISVAQKRGLSELDLFMELVSKKYIIDTNRTIDSNKIFDFYAEYPEFNVSGIIGNRVKDRNATQTKEIKIRAARYEELRQLWEELNRKYVIFYQNDVDKLIEDSLISILSDDIFAVQEIMSERKFIDIQDGVAVVREDAAVYERLNGKRIPYRDFLKRASRATSIPAHILHKAITEYSKQTYFEKDYINETSLVRFINKFNEWRGKNLQGRFNYRRAAETRNKTTALTNSDGSPKDVIAQGLVGVHMDNGIVSEKFLYDAIIYDSPLERENVIADIDEVTVYGKIPRKSISIPTIANSSYSPDFMYVVHRTNGEKELNIVIETKDVNTENDLREEEQIKISCAKKFFEQLRIDGYKVKFRTQLKHHSMKSIITDLLNA